MELIVLLACSAVGIVISRCIIFPLLSAIQTAKYQSQASAPGRYRKSR
ncbi:hypothetical protein [Denitratimonas sp. CY0512]